MAVIEKRGDLQWRALVRRRGFSSFSRTFTARRPAEAWARELEAAIGCRDLAAVRRLTGTGEELGGTIADLVDLFEREVLPRRGQAGSERPRLRRIRERFGKLSATMLTPLDVVRWRDERLREASPGTVRHDLNMLSVLLAHAISEWGVEGLRNVVRDTRKPAMPRGRDRRVSAQELDLLLRAARHDPAAGASASSVELEPLISLAVETSMRLGELIGLRWRDIDTQRRVATLRETKNGESRSVALSSAAMRALLQLGLSRAFRMLNARRKQVEDSERDNEKVFPWSRSDSVTKPFVRCVSRARKLYELECMQAGASPDSRLLSDLRFHDLRHEATSRLFEKGLNPMEVASMTGHKSMQMLKRYTHVEAERVAAKLD